MNFAGGTALMPGLSVVRIPEWILQELPGLERLRQFAPILTRFAEEYRTLIDSAAWSDEQQAALLKQTLQLLLGCDRRFAGSYNPLALLNFFEHTQGGGRDHYFHTFTNFLLGCVVIDRCHGAFDDVLSNRQGLVHGVCLAADRAIP